MTNSIEVEAGEVMQLLAGAGVRMALLETITAGRLADLLRATPAGMEVITEAQVFGGPDELSARLHVSHAKMDAFGLASEMVVAEAAAALIDTYEGGWGLALVGNCDEPGGVNEAAEELVVALGTPRATRLQRTSRSAAFRVALGMLRQEALASLERP